MQLTSTRFGTVEIPDEAIIDFPQGLVGIGGSRYALMARDDAQAFLWLQSLEDPDLALPVVSPWDFFPGFELELAQGDAERLTAGTEDAALYVTVRSADGDGALSANLRAPILIVGSTGWQLINQAADAPVRAPLAA